MKAGANRGDGFEERQIARVDFARTGNVIAFVRAVHHLHTIPYFNCETRTSACLGLFLAPSSSGCYWIGDDIDPLRMRRGLLVVIIVPVPPFVRRRLRIALGRVLPSFLTTQRSDVEIAPNGPQG